MHLYSLIIKDFCLHRSGPDQTREEIVEIWAHTAADSIVIAACRHNLKEDGPDYRRIVNIVPQ